MILGIDIGGTNIKFGVVTEDYQLVKSWSIPTLSHRDIAEIIDDMIEKAKEIRTEYHFDRIGIGTPGDIDSERGICYRAGNLPYNKTPLGIRYVRFRETDCRNHKSFIPRSRDFDSRRAYRSFNPSRNLETFCSTPQNA